MVAVNHDGVENTLGPFNLENAEATVTRLASEPASRERFSAYVVPVSDQVNQSQHAAAGHEG